MQPISLMVLVIFFVVFNIQNSCAHEHELSSLSSKPALFHTFPCQHPTMVSGTHVHCAYFSSLTRHNELQVTRERLKQQQVFLPVMLYQKDSQSVADKAVLIAGGGGPGNSLGIGTDNKGIHNLVRVIDEFVQAGYDVLFVDQRGTGLSQPILNCPGLAEQYEKSLGENLSMQVMRQHIEEVMLRCRTKLESTGVDVESFDTEESAYDFLSLMNNLSYDEWLVLGVSYGAQLAIKMASIAPQQIEGLVLDSLPNPKDEEMMLSQAELQSRVERIVHLCNEDSACHKRYPGLKVLFRQLLEHARHNPFVLPITDNKSLFVNESRLIDILFNATYWTETISLVPYAIHNAMYENQYDTLAWLARPYYEWMTDSGFGDVLQLNIYCHQQFPKQLDYHMREGSLGEHWTAADEEKWLATESLCKHWTDNLHAQYNEVLISVPSLILAGGLDPITPSESAARMQARLINSFLVEDPNVAHAVLASSECALQELKQFIAEPEFKGASQTLCSSQRLSFY